MAFRDWFFKDRSFHVKVVKDGPGGEEEVSPAQMVKTHFDTYKPFYIAGGSVVTLAGITCLMMRGNPRFLGRITDPGSGLDGLPTLPQASVASLFSLTGNENTLTNVANVTNNVVSGGRLSYICSVLKDGIEHWFESQADMARFLGCSESDVSRNIRNGSPIIGLPGINVKRHGISVA